MDKYNSNVLKKNIGFYNLLIYIVLLNACLSIFFYYFSLIFGGIAFYFLLLLLVLFSIYKLRNINFNKLQLAQVGFFLVWACFYFIVNQFFLNFENKNIIAGISFNIFSLQLIQVVCIFFIYFYINLSNKVSLKVNVIKIMMFSQIINAYITLRALNIDPEISKNMATGSAEFNTFNLIGVSGYSIIYSIVIIFPLLISSLKNTTPKFKVFILCYMAFMVIFIYYSAYTTAIIGLLAGIIFYNVLNRSRIFKIIFIPLLFILLGFIMTPYNIYLVLTSLAKKIDIELISLRLYQLADFILYNDSSGDSLVRFELYKNSIDAFLQYPITGITIYNPEFTLSGHSAFLDILGGTGLLGFIPYILFIWFSYKISIKNAQSTNIKNGIRASYLIFCFIASVNTLATSYIIMTFLLFFVTWYPFYLQKYTLEKVDKDL